MANCRYIRPVMPPRKATGTNTEHRTSTMATRARLTWRIARSAATAGDTPSLAMMRQVSRALRSEEHTSELQSRLHLVCRLLLEKKKKEIRDLEISHLLTRW